MEVSNVKVAKAIWVTFIAVMLASNIGCDDCTNIPGAKKGPNGESISISQITKGTSVPCIQTQVSGGNACFFTADFTVTGLSTQATALLLVQIDTLANGGEVCGWLPWPQGQGIAVTPDQTGQGSGQFQGQLGPPVTSAVRFDLVAQLLDSKASVIAASVVVQNLRPDLE